MHIFIINGVAQSGKSTFCEIVKSIIGETWCKEFSTVDKVKEIAKECGWNGEKNPESRKFLSDLKDLTTKAFDMPIKDIKEKLEEVRCEASTYGLNSEDFTIFIHCREPQEIKRLCQELNAKSLIIRRKEAEEIPASNHADANVLDYKYDIVVYNKKNLSALGKAAMEFVRGENLFFPYWREHRVTEDGTWTYF